MSSMTACIAVSGSIADYFLEADNPNNSAHAYKVARDYLDMDSDEFSNLLDVVASRLPAAEELFDISILAPAEITAILAEAKDLQMLRQLSKSRELERSSQRDALTGAHNRGFLDNVLRREFDLSTRHNWPLSVAMIDLDHFKNVNDTYGHPVGDSVLISVVRSVQAQLRPDDIFARYGGEEFVLVLPGTALEPTLKLLVRLKDSIASIEHEHSKGTPLRITASIGVVAHMDSGMRFDRPEDIIKAVDEALYLAKNSGRNRVESWLTTAGQEPLLNK